MPSADPAARLRAFASALDHHGNAGRAMYVTYPDVGIFEQPGHLADDIAAVLTYVPEPEHRP